MKKIIYILLAFTIPLFSKEYPIVKEENRVTNELVERYKKQYLEDDFEEARRSNLLSNWLVLQVRLEETIWADLIKIPQGTRMCGNKKTT
ncbi:hypothetical protein [Aliarcobacter butzleri]|uniref:hypothetical protein n=1 Tax=Aliarcobacter butzleri TaxID=28197 RepID=UPI0021B35B8E|nr:hypothetical protein [Aliarcobacter butzleri]MCT7568479.1 hypothetical protein [Aliarcobacter butzleri]